MMMNSKRVSIAVGLAIGAAVVLMAASLMLLLAYNLDDDDSFEISPSIEGDLEASAQEIRNITNSDMPGHIPGGIQPEPPNCMQPPPNGIIDGELLWCFVHRARRIWPFTHPHCGLRNWLEYNRTQSNSTEERILDTVAAAWAEEGEFPWFIRIVKKVVSYQIVDPAIFDVRSNTSLEHHCGGSLITDSRGLTAAHCCTKINAKISDYGLLIGYWKGSQPPQKLVGHENWRDVHACVTHPNYNSSDVNQKDDIAMLKWIFPIGPVKSGREHKILINTICLPLAPSIHLYVDGRSDFAGAGLYENIVGASRQAPRLRRGPLLILEYYIERGYGTISMKRRYFEQTAGCFGDSGSPITKWNWGYDRDRPFNTTLRSFQIGIASVLLQVYRRPNDCTMTRGMLMTNVSNYRDFILREVMNY